MAPAAHKLLEDALRLPEEERLELASELIASLDGPPGDGWDAAWLAELERRASDADRVGEKGTPWADARDRIFRRLNRR